MAQGQMMCAEQAVVFSPAVVELDYQSHRPLRHPGNLHSRPGLHKHSVPHIHPGFHSLLHLHKNSGLQRQGPGHRKHYAGCQWEAASGSLQRLCLGRTWSCQTAGAVEPWSSRRHLECPPVASCHRCPQGADHHQGASCHPTLTATPQGHQAASCCCQTVPETPEIRLG